MGAYSYIWDNFHNNLEIYMADVLTYINYVKLYKTVFQ